MSACRFVSQTAPLLIRHIGTSAAQSAALAPSMINSHTRHSLLFRTSLIKLSCSFYLYDCELRHGVLGDVCPIAWGTNPPMEGHYLRSVHADAPIDFRGSRMQILASHKINTGESASWHTEKLELRCFVGQQWSPARPAQTLRT